MRIQATIWACLVASLFTQPTRGGEPGQVENHPEPFLERLRPAGGWSPYGGGLVHWWPEHCFCDCGTPDDYCRKALPRTCWPEWPCHVNCGTLGLRQPQPNNTSIQRPCRPQP